jgi:hypothetical protein
MEDHLSAPPELARPPFFPPEEIWIFGAGRFGYLAAKRLSRRYPQAPMRVVDRREEKLAVIRDEMGVETIAEEAVAFLSGNPLADTLWIIPAVPIHLALEWMLAHLGKAGNARSLPVPEAVDSLVPNPFRTASGTLYASFATFICPDACNEPDEMCTYTRQPRPGILYEVLDRIRAPGFRTTVVRSWQLAPGVGGYTAGYLRKVLEGIQAEPGAHLVATCCRCHGVIDGLEWTPMA